jgi:cytochrome oxidase Cu insertion factor (SCO1/SenC/PrrC family)
VRRRGAAAFLLAALVAGALVTEAAAPDFASLQIQPYEPRKPAPAFSLPDLDGRPVTLESLRGKVVFLFFWTTW